MIVTVKGDTLIEPDESFFVNLSSPLNAVLGRGQAAGTIINDDGLPGQLDHFSWDQVSSPRLVSQPFAVTITAKDFFNATVSNFTGWAIVNCDAGVTIANTILGDLTHASTVTYGPYTLGYSFTPSTNITVTHVRHYFGSKVSLWTDSGVLLASQTVNSVPGAWTETPLATPVSLVAGRRYRVAAYTEAGPYYWRGDGSNTFAFGTIDQSYEIWGDTFPTTSDTVHWWLVDLRYSVGSHTGLPVAPTMVGPFSGGVWSSNLVVQAPGTNAVLRIDDGNGHTGSSNPFDVAIANDISLSMLDSPHPVSVGANLTYTLSISNTGPSNATAVVVTNILPSNAMFISASSSEGACSQEDGVVSCDLGQLAAAAHAIVSIVVVPTTAGMTLSNWATVSRFEADPYLANNSASTLTVVTTPQ